MLQMRDPLLPDHIERIATEIVDSAFKVHKALGPGLLETVYETCLVRELRKRGLSVATQVPVPITYDGEVLETCLRLDVLVEGLIIIEIKAVEEMNPVFEAQILTYLRLSGLRLVFLINFTVPRIKDGLRRVVR